jgi:hypothetical protein
VLYTRGFIVSDLQANPDSISVEIAGEPYEKRWDFVADIDIRFTKVTQGLRSKEEAEPAPVARCASAGAKWRCPRGGREGTGRRIHASEVVQGRGRGIPRGDDKKHGVSRESFQARVEEKGSNEEERRKERARDEGEVCK